ncbi:hypothetical protein PspLS_08168 [Pyricularia sp. CBS 133598]|nr:hypothetical protein PspLS_08168 [Pyricularia sp. CBS 133598]
MSRPHLISSPRPVEPIHVPGQYDISRSQAPQTQTEEAAGGRESLKTPGSRPSRARYVATRLAKCSM